MLITESEVILMGIACAAVRMLFSNIVRKEDELLQRIRDIEKQVDELNEKIKCNNTVLEKDK